MTWKKILSLFLILSIIIGFSHGAHAEWEIGARTAFDTNVNRSINNEDGDFLVTAYAAYTRQPSGETRVDWTLRALAEGTAYMDYGDLNSLSAMISPGIHVSINPQWTLNVSPFAQAKGVSDSDQSATAYGIRASLKQKWNKVFYTGQYYAYTDSTADEDVYSYTENAVGVFAGIKWTPALFTEVGYEYSRGDSFRTASTSAVTTVPAGKRGRHHGYSQTYQAEIYSETVDRNAISINVGYDFTKSFFALAGYTYTREEGDFDTMTFQTGFLGLGYRF